MSRLDELSVLALDCQATGATPANGHLLEIGWSTSHGPVVVRRLKLPRGAELSDRIRRLTGISAAELAEGDEPARAWRLLSTAASETAERNGRFACPTIVHFAPFEERFLRWLRFRAAPEAAFRFQLVCTHRIACRLFPELPRRSLRAVAGYLGHALDERRRAADHVAATLHVWRALVRILVERESVQSLPELFEWLRLSPPTRHSRPRYPMHPEALRDLPRGPGTYCMLRADGGVLYVGKATSLRERVSSYFRSGARHPEHVREMLAQARDLRVRESGTSLEAALLEAEGIQTLQPPYNRALRRRDGGLVFATPQWDDVSQAPDDAHTLGPLPASPLWPAFRSLHRYLSGIEPHPPAHVVLALPASYAPDEESFGAGLEAFGREVGRATLLAFGRRMWRAEPEEELELAFRLEPPPGSRSRHAAPEEVAARLRELARRGAHLVRRARWHVTLGESTLAWRERDGEGVCLVLSAARVHEHRRWREGEEIPPSPTMGRPWAKRSAGLDRDGYDRMTVLTREVRRLLTEGAAPALRVSARLVLEPDRIARWLRWI